MVLQGRRGGCLCRWSPPSTVLPDGGNGARPTTIDSALSLAPVPLVALTVNFVVPVASGMPVIAPVEAFSVIPLGKAPAVIVQVIGASPLAVKD